ncbi:rhodanese-like domain-containing protein [Micromonospora sp. S2-005]
MVKRDILPPAGSRGIDEILAAARSRLRRLSPIDAHAAQRAGAVIVDIRPAAQRSTHGEIPGAVVIERNVLEWRLDPRSDARLGFADGYDLAVVVVCQEGYTSSLAAAALHDLGLQRATDVVGGFAAWQAGGLPVEAGSPGRSDPAAAQGTAE